MEYEIEPGDFALHYEGDTIVFAGAKEPGEDPKKWKVYCPVCNEKVSRRSARRHHMRVHSDDAGTADAAGATDTAGTLNAVETSNAAEISNATETLETTLTTEKTAKKRKSASADSESQDDAEDLVACPKNPTQDVLQEITGNVPVELAKSFIATMCCSPHQVVSKHAVANNAFGVIMSDRSAQRLADALKPGFRVEKINLTDAHLTPMSEIDLTMDYDELTEEHLEVIEKGGAPGRERLVGSVIKTGATWLQIFCVESYNRNCLEDPHAEPATLNPSSVPNNSRMTQYRGRLKITVLWDGYGKPRLIIGVRGHNYLITSGNHDGTTIIGPTRCGQIPVSERTTLSIKKKRQNPNEFDEDILGLAQVRSHFGHRATYAARRTGLVGYSALAQMPITIFTIALWNKESLVQASVFYRLWCRSKEPGPGPILHLDDLNVHHETDTKPGRYLQSLRLLFSMDGTLNISTNSEAERILSGLAKHFAALISDKNKIVQSNIISTD
ncbi:hypothetical protein EDD21DRAFT_74783 [Dissophora ornata]|nr:hypothetical protein BGZ58_004427 [Dissophora ornata]KAI8594669.1 hypothetical protein EDD21DRAFT_74783 [Dissophora ornata]